LPLSKCAEISALTLWPVAVEVWEIEEKERKEEGGGGEYAPLSSGRVL